MSACALCRTPAPPPFRAPAPEGSPDLDGRPGEPTRSTLLRWLQTCDGCGACAPDLAALPTSAQEAVQVDTYHTLKSPFERWAALAAGTPDEAQAWLQGAWLAEDAGKDGTEQRRRAITAWPKPADAEGMVRLGDIQRRAGLLADAAATLDAIPRSVDDALARIIAFERARIMAGDTGRQLLSSALRPPARTPHVSHRQRTATTVWSRLVRVFQP